MADLSFGIEGLDFLNEINLTGLFQNVYNLVLFTILAVIITAIVAFILYRRKNEKLFNITLHFFEDINGKPVPVKDYSACELVIPNTNIRVFYVKENDFYLPRGTRLMGKNRYWYMMLKNKEIINFELGSINKELEVAKALYDHSDARFGHENLKQIIKREYRDKAVKWWKEYKEVISLVILIFVMTLGFIFIISKISNLVSQIGGVIESMKPMIESNKEVLKLVAEIKSNSGIVIK